VLRSVAVTQTPPALEPWLARALDQARAAWPGIDVPAPPFLQAVAAAIAAGPAPGGDDPLARVHITDLYLACGCVLGLPAATRTFVSQHLAAVPRYLGHIDPSAWLAEEVAQALAVKLLVARPPDPPRIAGYGGRGPLDSWVAVAAQRAALSLLRKRDPAAPGSASDLEGALSVGLDPELRLARAEVKRQFEGGLRVALGALGARDRMLLRLSLVAGLSCQKIGKIYGVNASTASRWIARARDQVLAHLQRHLEQTHGLDPAELGSLLGLARSQIELSLSGVLGDGPPGTGPDDGPADR
jgi:RNA polymerase sigma-70 factor (ECF subfamily)